MLTSCLSLKIVLITECTYSFICFLQEAAIISSFNQFFIIRMQHIFSDVTEFLKFTYMNLRLQIV